MQSERKSRNEEKGMENLYSVVPYNDSSNVIPCTDQILMFDESPSLGLLELPSIEEPGSYSALIPQSEVGDDGAGNILDPDDPLSDPFIWEVINDTRDNVVGNWEAGPSGFDGERIGQEYVINSHIPQSSGFGNPKQLTVWSGSPSPYTCSCCHVLREIIHINGKYVRNLEIHGRLGIISHAVLDKFDLDLSENHEYQMLDFCKESISVVKNFLVQYCEDRKREGYTMVQDPLSIFYQALCVGFNENDSFASNDFLQSSPMASDDEIFIDASQMGNFRMNQQNLANQREAESNGVGFNRNDSQEMLSQQEAESKGAEHARSFLATQRERTGKLKLKDFSGYFHLPINDAAKKLNICPTVIKKKCRQGGLSRWPYRKIKGIKRKILKKKVSLTAGTVEERARALEDIRMLEQDLENIFRQLSN